MPSAPTWKFSSIFLLMSFLFFLTSGVKTTFADCGVSASPTEVQPNTPVNFYFNIENYSDPAKQWIKITKPTVGITITSAAISGWSSDITEPNVIFFTGNLLNAYYPVSAEINTTIGTAVGTGNWTVQVSDSPNGTSPTSCTGSVGLTISGAAPDTIAPTITGLTISDITSSSVVVNWATNEPTNAIVNYGIEYSGPTNQSVATLSTSHSVTLSTSIAAATTYYFSVCSTDATGNQTCTNDNTFTTAVAGSTAATITVVTTTVVITPTPTPPPPKDNIAPSVSISTDFSKPYKEAPTIEGRSTDGGAINAGVISVDYSLDGGKNWLPVDNIDTIGKKSVTFDFTPVGLDDGNYLVKVRSKDITGNTGSSKTYTLVIDRLPPQVGGTLFFLGPMILKPDAGGTIYSIAGIEIKAALSAVGGPISMDLFFDSQKYSLTKNIESGLWNGTLAFDKTGSFPLKIKSIDGANNETERTLSTIVSLPPGIVSDENNKTISKAKIKVYTFEKTLNDFTPWDGLPYSQVNPQETDKDGQYRLILPSGKYFIEVEASGKRKLRSNIFELSSTTPINQNLKLDNAFLFLGNWWSKTVTFSFADTAKEPAQKNNLVGKPMPDFDISSGTDLINNTTILGKPTILSFLSSWEPQTSDQLLAMDSLQTEYPGINVIAIISQESPSKVEVFKKLGGYGLPIYADRDGVLVVPLGLESLPTHIFLDRKGIIKDVTVGFLDRDDLLNKILE